MCIVMLDPGERKASLCYGLGPVFYAGAWVYLAFTPALRAIRHDSVAARGRTSARSIGIADSLRSYPIAVGVHRAIVLQSLRSRLDLGVTRLDVLLVLLGIHR